VTATVTAYVRQLALRSITMRGLFLMTCGLSLVTWGCEAARDEDSLSEAERPSVSRTARDGPVLLTLSVTPAEIDVSEHAQVRVEVSAKQGVTVEVDDYRNALTGFEYRVVSATKEVAKPSADGRLRWTYRYELEFFLPGEVELPPARIRFLDETEVAESEDSARADQTQSAESTQPTWRDLKTESLTVIARDSKGTSLSEEELHRITMPDPVELPRPWSRWWWLGPLAFLAVIALVGLIRRRTVRRRDGQVILIPADVWASRRIAELVGDDLPARGLVQEFYYRLSDIVRGYVERRFAVSAPEMTTEEFLATAATDNRFEARQTKELDRFLGACDLVKYARHEPALDDADAMLKAARRFIEETRERVGPGCAPEAGAQPMKERAA